MQKSFWSVVSTAGRKGIPCQSFQDLVSSSGRWLRETVVSHFVTNYLRELIKVCVGGDLFWLMAGHSIPQCFKQHTEDFERDFEILAEEACVPHGRV